MKFQKSSNASYQTKSTYVVLYILQKYQFLQTDSVWRIRDVYPGSRIRLFSISDPGSRITVSIPDPGSSLKNISILTPKKAKKWFLSSKKYIWVVHPGSWIRMLTFSHPGIRIQGSKRHPIPDPGSGSATLDRLPTFFKIRCQYLME
jgi:hypothetical protein